MWPPPIRYASWTIERNRGDARLIEPARAALCEQILVSAPIPRRDFEPVSASFAFAGPMAPNAPSRSARKPMARSNPSSTTSSIGVPRQSAAQTERQYPRPALLTFARRAAHFVQQWRLRPTFAVTCLALTIPLCAKKSSEWRPYTS